MSARDELEAAIWRALAKPRRPADYTAVVDAILTAADAYAVAAGHAAEDAPVATARRRAVLAEAIGDLYSPKGQHRWRAS